MKKIVCATHNKNKILEFGRMLSPLGIEVLSCEDLGITEDIEETGKTFEENAKIKARYVCDIVGLPAFADDSGLVVDALGGEPGIFSARYGKPDFNDRDRNKYLLNNMEGKTDRSARFMCSICISFPDGRDMFITESCEGSIGYEEAGDNGFGYDPIFMIGDRSFGQIDGEEKDRISHRGKATRKFITLIEEEWREIDAHK